MFSCKPPGSSLDAAPHAGTTVMTPIFTFIPHSLTIPFPTLIKFKRVLFLSNFCLPRVCLHPATVLSSYTTHVPNNPSITVHHCAQQENILVLDRNAVFCKDVNSKLCCPNTYKKCYDLLFSILIKVYSILCLENLMTTKQNLFESTSPKEFFFFPPPSFG